MKEKEFNEEVISIFESIRKKFKIKINKIKNNIIDEDIIKNIKINKKNLTDISQIIYEKQKIYIVYDKKYFKDIVKKIENTNFFKIIKENKKLEIKFKNKETINKIIKKIIIDENKNVNIINSKIRKKIKNIQKENLINKNLLQKYLKKLNEEYNKTKSFLKNFF
ncbi:hypothetical protein ACT2CI_00485 [Candidatus Vidania fulgoroideorum]